MFELKISNLTKAKRLSQEWATHTISLLNPEFENHDEYTSILPIAGKNSVLRRYFFDDVSPAWDDYLDQNLKAATYAQIQKILEFSAPLQPTDKLLVHCHAGISRSTAVACGVLCQHGFTPNDAVKYVLSIRPQAVPNQYIIILFDDILGLERKLIATIG